jgi:transposase
MLLFQFLSDTWDHIQESLFPWLTEEVGPLTDMHRKLIAILEVSRIHGFVQSWVGLPGRPPRDRAALARAFIAKAVMQIPTTVMLIERLRTDKQLRRLCGWETSGQVPSEATFSRAFAEFARSELPSRVHEALIKRTHEDRIVGHISRDATAIEAREKPVSVSAPEKPKRKRGRPKKGVVVAKQPRRLERQGTMSLAEMLADLPTHCSVGTKRNAKGHTVSWIGYKLHLDVADGDIPVSAVLTSASLHDSQAAIPLAMVTARRVSNLYDLMDSAYDVPEIAAGSRALGHVPIIDKNPRNTAVKEELETEVRARKAAGYTLAEDVRYNERSASERVNARLKDDFGGRNVRVRGHTKVLCHMMFAVLTLAADQIMRLII